MKRISYLETCHPRNLLSGIHAFVLRLDSRLRGNDSEVVSLHAARFTRCVCYIVLLFSLHASLFTFHAHAKLETGMAADIVLGQPDFTSSASNNGGIGPRSSQNPQGCLLHNQKLLISEELNHRIKIWNKVPRSFDEPPDIVLGQPDFVSSTANNGGISAQSLRQPYPFTTDGTKLIVPDIGNHRILIWNEIPTTSHQRADIVLGQPNFASDTANNGGRSAVSLSSPTGASTNGTHLAVADQANNRVLVWNSIPASNRVPADIVIGQPNFASATVNNGGLSAKTLNGVRGVAVDRERLYVSDSVNHRVLIWNKIPTENFQAADIVLGQPDFVSNAANAGGLGSQSLFVPYGIFSDGEKLYVVDSANNRVLIWNRIPTRNSVSADVVLGKPTFESASAVVSSSVFTPGLGIATNGSQLCVPCTNQHRVLIFNISDTSIGDLGPQFSQGKAVVGKVFWDFDGDGRQDGGIS